jgi:DNA-binding beta-propeller fold protein YncE
VSRRAAAASAVLFLFFFAFAPAPRATGSDAPPRGVPLPTALRDERLLDRERLRACGIERPSRLAFDETGALYVLDARTRLVVRLALGSRPAAGDDERGDAEGTLVFGDASATSSLPHDLVFDLRGSLLVLDRAGATLLAYDARAAYLGARDLDPSLTDEARSAEARLLRDAYGDLWLLAPREGDLVPLDGRLRRRRTGRFLTPEDSLSQPVAAAFLPHGGGWVADRGRTVISRFDATGLIVGSVTLGDSLGGTPTDLASDDAGSLFVADAGASRIVVLGPDGSHRFTRWLGGAAKPWRPGAIAWGGGDRVAVADESRDEIWIFAVRRETTP